MAISKWQVPEVISSAFAKALTPANVSAGFAKAGIHPLKRDWVKSHSHVFTVSESLTVRHAQPDAKDAIYALALKKFDDLVQSSAVCCSRVSYLDLSVTPEQQAHLSEMAAEKPEPATDADAATTSPDFSGIMQLPKPVEKKKLSKRRLNAIGESFSSPKQLNEPARVGHLRDHFKRKAEELLEQQQKKKAKKDAEDPVAKVLRELRYIGPNGAVTVAVMKAFLRRNAGKLQMPRAATHAKRADQLAYLKAAFAERPEEKWLPAATPSCTQVSCCKAGCDLPDTLVLRQCAMCAHAFHHICTTDDMGKMCKCCVANGLAR